MDYKKKAKEIYRMNRDLGWWDKPRDEETLKMLWVSELAEALEGDRKDLMDDHLPEYPMFDVELADFMIRVLDCYGYKLSEQTRLFRNLIMPISAPSVHTKRMANKAHALYRLNRAVVDGSGFKYILNLTMGVAEHYDIDILSIIDEKLAYNQQRADHKRENRAKAGGKKY